VAFQQGLAELHQGTLWAGFLAVLLGEAIKHKMFNKIHASTL